MENSAIIISGEVVFATTNTQLIRCADGSGYVTHYHFGIDDQANHMIAIGYHADIYAGIRNCHGTVQYRPSQVVDHHPMNKDEVIIKVADRVYVGLYSDGYIQCCRPTLSEARMVLGIDRTAV